MRKYNYIIFLMFAAVQLLKTPALFGAQLREAKISGNKGDTINVRENELLVLPMGLSTTRRANVGAISVVKGQELETYPDLQFSNTLQGRLTGLTVRQTSNGLGNNEASLYVRGLSRGSADDPLTIVDGIERRIDFLNPEEIETVEVLKDPSSKILYGPRAANGVILITTKRGKANTKVFKAGASYGMSMAQHMPVFLNSYDYATLYNEARLNDGLPPLYSDADLQGYRNSSGPLDQKYPDVDYYDYFLNNSAPFRKANLEYSGGGEGSRYAFMLGYTGANGFEKIGKTPTQDRVNLRGNLDFKVNSVLRAFVDGNAIVEMRQWSKLWQSDVFSALNSHRPNEYPLILTDPSLQGEGDVLGQTSIPPLGGSFQHPNNLYGNLVYGGYSKHNYFYGQTNFGLDLDLGKVIKGLSAKSVFTFDNYQFFQSGKNETPVTYARIYSTSSDGTETVNYVNLQKRVVQSTLTGDESRTDESIVRNTGWTTNLNYALHSGKNDLNANLSYFYFRNEDRDNLQDIENSNSVLRLNYNYNNKFYTEGTLAYMGSNKFARGNRFGLFPALGAAWVLSEERFLKDSPWISFLKVKSSFGILGYDRAVSFYLYQNRWFDNGAVSFGQPNNITSEGRTGIDWLGNPDLKWEKSREFNAGLEGAVLQRQIQFEFNYFNEFRYDMILSPDNLYSSFSSGLYPRINMGKTKNTGIEGQVDYHTRAGRVKTDIGFNFVYSKNKVVTTNEVDYPDKNLRITGLPSDAIFGYVANGLFTSSDQLNNAPGQMLGTYGIGDLSYQDVNEDGIIDGRDQEAIGNNFPRATFGIDINLHYKGFGLYVLGTSELGRNVIADNAYYRNSGEGKYSELALERYHPVNNPDGTYPELTTLNNSNNNANSTFWLKNTDFIRLKNVELSYSVSPSVSWLKGYRFYLRGTNLLVLSGIKTLDPEVLNAGVTNYPIYRTITAGVSANF